MPDGSKLPQPCGVPGKSAALQIAVQKLVSEKYWRTKAAAPAADGEAIEVPVFSTVLQVNAALDSAVFAEIIESPGAIMSGLIL